MLSALFQSRNQSKTSNSNSKLSQLTTKKIDLPKISPQTNPSSKQTQLNNTQNKSKQPQSIIQNQKPQCTIFVGNVHLQTKHNQLKKLFQNKYGKVQKVWFRSIPVEANKMGRKASFIMKKYIQGANSMNAYVRFATKDIAQSACQQNGAMFKGLNLRVNMSEVKDTDTKSTVFVGNLSHDIKQQELRDHFASIGNILSVRVVKSRITNKGIGIGYVHYENVEDMKRAITELNGTELLGRQIRVKKAVQKERLQKKAKKIQTKYGKKQNKTSKNSKAIEFRKKGKQIKQNRQLNKKKPIHKN